MNGAAMNHYFHDEFIKLLKVKTQNPKIQVDIIKLLFWSYKLYSDISFIED